MADTAGWISKHVLLPLSPFILGAVVRYICRDAAGIEIFDPADLAFSVAMLSLLVVLSANRLDDEQLGEAISGIYGFTMFMFVGLFVLTVVLQTQSQDASHALLAGMGVHPSEPTTAMSYASRSLNSGTLARATSGIDKLRWLVFATSAIAVTGAVYCKHKFPLED